MQEAPGETTSGPSPLPPPLAGEQAAAAPPPPTGGERFPALLLVLFIAAMVVIRWHFLAMPLERDEGEYAYLGHLILSGVVPYHEAYTMKLPGVPAMYALFMSLLGEDIRGIHLGCLMMNAATMVLLFLAVRSFFASLTAALTAGFYGFMSLSHRLLACAAHATHFVVFFVALGLFFLARYERRKTALTAALTGGMLGMAFLMKQQAAPFILFGGLALAAAEGIVRPVRPLRTALRLLSFAIGVFTPYLLVAALMAATGSFARFWFWTVEYAGQYVASVPWSQGAAYLALAFAPLWEEFRPIWLLAGAGMAALALSGYTTRKKIMALLFLLCSFLATTPGLLFRQHYFIVLIPAVSLLAAIALDYTGSLLIRPLVVRNRLVRPNDRPDGNGRPRTWVRIARLALPPALWAIAVVGMAAGNHLFASDVPLLTLCKEIYATNPFVESVEIAQYLKAHSPAGERIAVLGSEPQIPFYAGRRSATGYIYTYGLMEPHPDNLKMQEEMIREIERSKPLFLIACNIRLSWLPRRDSPQRIFEWYRRYAEAFYTVAGLVEIPARGPSRYYWGTEAQRPSREENRIWILKRKEASGPGSAGIGGGHPPAGGP